MACLIVIVEFLFYVAKECVKTHTPFKTALVKELKFYFRFSGMVKPVVYNHSEKDSTSRKSTEEGEEIAYNMVKKGESCETLRSKSNKSSEKKEYKKQESNKTF